MPKSKRTKRVEARARRLDNYNSYMRTGYTAGAIVAEREIKNLDAKIGKYVPPFVSWDKR